MVLKCSIGDLTPPSTAERAAGTTTAENRNHSVSTTNATTTVARPRDPPTNNSILERASGALGAGVPTSSRQITALKFEELYRENAKHRYTILCETYTHPANGSITGDFWVLACGDHNTHYWAATKGGAKKAAEKHLSMHRSDYDPRSAPTTRIFECFGIPVHGCDEEKASLYNKWVQTAVSEGLYQKETHASTQKRKMKRTVDDRAPDLPVVTTVDDSNDDEDEDDDNDDDDNSNPKRGFVESPEPGKLYIVSLRKGREKKKPFAGLTLPFGDFTGIGLPGSFDESGLADTLPDCYKPRSPGQGPPVWSRGFEEGRKRKMRKFPFLCFDHDRDLQACSKAWIPVRDVQPFDADGFDTKYKGLVEQYRRRIASMTRTNQGE